MDEARLTGLRPAHTPAVLITRGRIDQQLGKIAGLAPLDERRKVFRLLIAVLTIADARRRERFCSDGCGHNVALPRRLREVRDPDLRVSQISRHVPSRLRTSSHRSPGAKPLAVARSNE
ncbi:DUF5958 family protein [Streptomyces sp. NPDC005480]|uniref:DUF5958 family protein n=1 Tax=Streptomyces sp. NPDC005480 TaxID=3154880 RepID=UPI0033AE076D